MIDKKINYIAKWRINLFEQIKFEEMEIRTPVAFSKDRHQPAVLKTIPTNLNDFTEYYSRNQEDTAFVMEGLAKVLYSPPITTFAKQNFLYMQVFSLLDAGENYHTRRKGFPYYLLLYTYEGEGGLEYKRKTYKMSSGTGCVIDCMEPHAYFTSGKKWKHCILHYAGKMAEWIQTQYMTDGTPIFVRKAGSPFQKNLEELLCVNQKMDIYREYDVSMCLNKLLMDIVKEKNKEILVIPDDIRYLQCYLENNFTQDMTLDKIADFMNMSKYHLEREFKKYIGQPIIAYITELRMARAYYYLSNTNISIGQISEMSGFSDYPNFLKLFKARTNMTPREYRAGARTVL